MFYNVFYVFNKYQCDVLLNLCYYVVFYFYSLCYVMTLVIYVFNPKLAKYDGSKQTFVENGNFVTYIFVFYPFYKI
jgi:hypothetical protein